MSNSKDFDSVIVIRDDNKKRDLQLLRNIYAYGWSEMSLAQQIMLPKLIGGEFDDVSFQYPSGMGKSGVYILTLLYNMTYTAEIKGLIVAPTRELAKQVYLDCKALATNLDINICLCVGREPLTQIDSSKPTIVIGTCGKIVDIMCYKDCSPLGQKCNLEYLVVDEADNFICDSRNRNIQDLKSIISSLCEEDTHLITISATFSEQVKSFIRHTMMRKNGNNIEQYIDDAEVTLSGIDQYYIDLSNYIDRREAFKAKIETLNDIIPVVGLTKAIIFVNSANHANQVYDFLTEEKYTCKMIYGKMSQEERNQIMKDFKLGSNFLIATDLVARGIDFKDISYVVQLELPATMEDYIHRIGRSGRYGKVGKAITIIHGNDEWRNLKIIADKYEINLKQFEFN